jgi:hypothetical protein
VVVVGSGGGRELLLRYCQLGTMSDHFIRPLFFLSSFFFPSLSRYLLYQSAQLAQGLRSWVEDIQSSEKAAEDATKKGLEMLTEQIDGLEQCSNDIIEAAKKQALLTIQYGVPYIPDGTDEWRKKLESGEANDSLMKLTGKITAQVATVTGVPQTVVNAAVESKTGSNPGGSKADQLKSMMGVGGDDNKEDGDGDEAKKKEEEGGGGGGGEGDVEMVVVDVNAEDEVKEAEGGAAGDASLPATTDEQAALLGSFRPPKQPEELRYENHKLCFKLMCALCCVNIVLAIVIAAIPGI